MSEPVLIALIATVAPTIVAAASLVLGFRTRRTVVEYEHRVNSRLDQLLALTATLARLEGHAAGMENERQRQAAEP